MHTIDDAQKLWCPMARAIVEGTPIVGPFNRSIGNDEDGWPCCIADQCAMWRWREGIASITEEGHGGDLVLRTKRKPGEKRLGYCGLAGRPAGAAI